MNISDNYYNNLFLHDIFRKWWEQHVMWTRSYIISTTDDLADLEFVTNRLLKNPIDFESILEEFYGNKIADEFRNLLTEHLLIAADLVNAAKQGNTKSVEEIRKKWYANSDNIADFLGAINPYWNQKKWKKMLYSHLMMTEEEAVSSLAGEYEENIKLYDEIENEALQMADYMSEGIIKQFKIY